MSKMSNDASLAWVNGPNLWPFLLRQAGDRQKCTLIRWMQNELPLQKHRCKSTTNTYSIKGSVPGPSLGVPQMSKTKCSMIARMRRTLWRWKEILMIPLSPPTIKLKCVALSWFIFIKRVTHHVVWVFESQVSDGRCVSLGGLCPPKLINFRRNSEGGWARSYKMFLCPLPPYFGQKCPPKSE